MDAWRHVAQHVMMRRRQTRWHTASALQASSSRLVARIDVLLLQCPALIDLTMLPCVFYCRPCAAAVASTLAPHSLRAGFRQDHLVFLENFKLARLTQQVGACHGIYTRKGSGQVGVEVCIPQACMSSCFSGEFKAGAAARLTQQVGGGMPWHTIL